MPGPAYFAAQHKLAMSLGHVLSGCKRARVPDHVLMLCRPADAQVVENILSVLQDTVPCANITLAVLRAHSNIYEISIPVRSGNVSLQDMMALQQYSPARIAYVCVLCNTPQHSATNCNTIQRIPTYFNTLQRTATHCNTLQHTASHCNIHCNMLNHNAPHCTTLQHTATHCNTLQTTHSSTVTATHSASQATKVASIV